MDKALSDSNRIHLELNNEAVPMVYPYLTNDASLRSRLIEHKVFVATYWPNVNEWTNSELFEHDLSAKLIPIPCDQRYGKENMERIMCIIGSEIE